MDIFTDRPTKSPNNIALYGFIILCGGLLLFVETFSFLVLHYVIKPSDSWSFYNSPTIEQAEFKRYLQQRDPFLGWPPPAQIGTKAYDSAGARPTPAFPEPGNECVAIYGDSFTYASDVDHKYAWGNVLSEKLRCRVANFGVGGYGTDQALLRFLHGKSDPSELVILGIYPHNIMRNVNQNHFFLNTGDVFKLKPRFILQGDTLRLVDIPDFTFDQFAASFQKPGDFYRHETFRVGSPDGPIQLSFPYILTFAKYFSSERVRHLLFGRPGWLGFLAESHPSRSLQITTKIIQKFQDEARRRNKKMLALTFPTPSSINYLKRSGENVLDPLLKKLEYNGIDFLDLHKPLLKKLGGESFCSILGNTTACNGHFNAAGNRMVADAVHARIGSALAPTE